MTDPTSPGTPPQQHRRPCSAARVALWVLLLFVGYWVLWQMIPILDADTSSPVILWCSRGLLAGTALFLPRLVWQVLAPLPPRHDRHADAED